MVPPAPVAFSTITGWPSGPRNRSDKSRPIVSLGPPAANGTTMVIGFDGQACAKPGRGNADSAAAPAASFRNRRRWRFIASILLQQPGEPNRDHRGAAFFADRLEPPPQRLLDLRRVGDVLAIGAGRLRLL